jgi:DNA-binding MarR family transcriptional regulator
MDGRTTNRVSSYVKRLEGRGHLTRRPHRSDRRSYRIHLTAAGRRTHRHAVTLFGPVRLQVIQSLNDQDGRVQESLLRLRSVVDTAGRPQEPRRLLTRTG